MDWYLVNRIRPVLRLQTKGAVFAISCAILSCYRAIQEVRCVELDTWLAGGDLQDSTTGCVTDPAKNLVFSGHLVFRTKLSEKPTLQHASLPTALHQTIGRSCGQTLDQVLSLDGAQAELAF